ncbi:MAG: MBL fold metallo-hydrolase [Candidatus Niyogibacteria bacterium CG10_big_fil_rev_8_21_14_0_10_46_36]|uniref:MBL fold metallo-hydrolase n=1 Tax=Candidatus Niyogibacteria bacterium CG10_big_fil_rev_8_21_14_0_10_46_36 TaxID=1974726 RepID=A0A2H0TCF2_9BACT|nr:MAG: MBL fold metallo-hydrolase [Candidatus Niyogibacteria bacterium CG10_big_fil_rev_8_21_14_0_10_46_36]
MTLEQKAPLCAGLFLYYGRKIMLHVRAHSCAYIFFGLLFVAIFLWGALFAFGGEGSREVVMYFLDIGQGDAIFIETPDHVQMLIDGGPNKKILSELGSIMPFTDRTIDVVLLSHPHEDHVGGLIDVLDRYDVRTVVAAETPYDSGAFREWDEKVDAEGAEHVRALRGMRIWLASDVWFDVLAPASFIQEEPANIHDAMIVGKLVYGNTCVIFTGDMERDIERSLLGDDIGCEVLKVGHHGSKTSTSDAFLKAVSPSVAVISAGRNNRYGHPHDVILNKLEKAGIRILRTDIDSTVILRSNGENVF